MSDVRDVLGKRIRELRKKQELSQEQLAEKLNTQYTYISDIERGRRNLTLTTLAVIADILNVEVYELLLPINENGLNEESLQQEAIALIKTLEKKELNMVVKILREFTNTQSE